MKAILLELVFSIEPVLARGWKAGWGVRPECSMLRGCHGPADCGDTLPHGPALYCARM